MRATIVAVLILIALIALAVTLPGVFIVLAFVVLVAGYVLLRWDPTRS